MSSIPHRGLRHFLCVYRKRDQGWFPVSFPVFLLMKEQHAMERTFKQERLPEGMALVETTDGRWFPAFALSSDILFGVYRVERSPLIDPARNSLHKRVPGYTCREEAIEAFYTWNETCELTQNWRWFAALTEVYPERNAWYLDEIVQLTGRDDTPHMHYGISVQAMVPSQEALTALKSLLRQGILPMKPSKPSTSACTSGQGCFKPPHAAQRHPSHEVRRRTESLSVRPGISHFKHSLTLEGKHHEKN